MPCGVCQEVFSKSFWKPFGAPLLTSVLSIPPPAPEVKNFLLKSCTISGDPRHDFLCSLPIDFLLAVVYNENSARCVRQRAVEEGIVHFDEKRGATPLLGPAHIQKFKQIFVLVWECPPSSVKCSASISHPMRLITSIAAALLSTFINSNHTAFSFFFPFCLSAQSRAERTSSRFTFVGSIDSPKCHPSRTFLLSSIRTAGASATRRIQSALVLP